ncbi:RagB/SusD family nutrient uptake outer membrane protein [Pedobacter rhodius]|uniref:RagB/SusD family nutrient uptake outer membrane protein n=1 Tax=Pedobacter rhodius TaxID=3004098 RepID=A0ABT4KU51_9SPHI|nr:RagB/SusD family nutrient uptake outer membrane protein [Pedobacter sp. SJ11]MCZ4222447.1 RagB/SusD family nutrient uptake outer membrane protein [Pedobacter sp. SJ11]
MKKNIILAAVLTTVLATTACRKEYFPSTQIDETSALTNAGDIETATIGTYALFKDLNYVRSGHFLTEFPSDEVAQGQNSSDDLTNLYKYTHLINSSHASLFWSQSYKAAGAANKIIQVIDDNATSDLKQLKGENLYIRAMMHFNLVRIFGRPYYQNSGDNPGIPILKEGLTDDQKLTLPRSKVKDVYDFIIADLIKAADLMTVAKTNPFASKEVAYALLSRVYLYQENNQKAIEYASKVISSGRYALLQGAEYQTYFRAAPEGNKETIFCTRHIKTEDRGYSAIGSMYYSGDANGVAQNQAFSGWGEIYASKKYFDFLSTNPADKRLSFISSYKVNGVVQNNTKLTPNTPMHYINKYNLQEGIVNLSSPVYLRLSEMYLNRAEANAKLNNDQLALDDVNIIRTRAGIPNYTIASVAAAGKSILDVVLEERWLEHAFEGQRAYDLFRNGRSMIRNYPGTHAVSGNVNQTVTAFDNRVVSYIPLTEINKNPALTQNP